MSHRLCSTRLCESAASASSSRFRRGTIQLAGYWLLAALSHSSVLAQQTFVPSDPIASIDGDPILLGELNYLLASKLRVDDPIKVSIEVQQASSALLVRQHLAMKSLLTQGGESLQSMLDRQWIAFVNDVKRQGSTIDRYSKQRKSNEQSVRRSRDWDTAWGIYLRRMMTESNLKRFYEMNSEDYASTKWKVSHIFVPVEDDQPNAEEIAEQRIRQIVDQLDSASDLKRETRFAELAMSESDGATAREGGMIGWVSKPGDLPESLMKAIRATSDGAVTAAVRSPLGFHLAFVHEQSSMEVPFEKVADRSKLRRDAADKLFETLIARRKDAKVIWYITGLRPPKK